MKEFKIRASGCSHIVSGTMGASESQLKNIEAMEARDKPMTENQQAKYDRDVYTRDNPVLPDGVKTYVQQWVKEQLYARRKEFSGKYTDKGIIMEDDSLDYIADKLGYGFLLKNEEFFEDEYMQGTPDAITADHIIDVKNSWDCFTFPLFTDKVPNDDYYWQAQVYMHLLGKDKYKLIYTLMDTPIHLIEKAFTWENPMELEWEEFQHKFLYNKFESNLRIKVFDIEKNDSDVALIIERVKACREYIKELLNKI